MADPVQQGQTPRMRALQNLASQLPVANQKVAAGQQAARDIQLQRAVQAAPTAAPTTQAAQTTGAAMAAQAGQQAGERAQQQVQQAGQIGGLGLAEEARAGQARVSGLQSGAREQQMAGAQKLASISEKAKQEVFDKQLQFDRDEMGRVQFNERQLADYARVQSKTDDQFRDYTQKMEQLNKRNLEAMEHAYRVVEADLTQKYNEARQKGDQKAMLEAEQIKKEMAEKIQKERNKASNTAAMLGTVGTIAGGVVGAIYGGPVGAAAGASVGGAAGGMVGSQVS